MVGAITEIVKVLEVPIQPPVDGVTAIVAAARLAPVFTALNEAISPVPLAAKPIDVLLSMTPIEKEKFSETGKAALDAANMIGSIAFLGMIHGKGGLSERDYKKIDDLLDASHGEDIGKLKDLWSLVGKNELSKVREILSNTTVEDVKKATTIYKSMPKEFPEWIFTNTIASSPYQYSTKLFWKIHHPHF